MKELGENFSKSGIEAHGFSSLDNVFWNLNQEDIYKIILDRGEGKISKDGALVVKTGIHTGRSAQDKFVVRESKNKTAKFSKPPSERTYRKSVAPFLFSVV